MINFLKSSCFRILQVFINLKSFIEPSISWEFPLSLDFVNILNAKNEG